MAIDTGSVLDQPGAQDALETIVRKNNPVESLTSASARILERYFAVAEDDRKVSRDALVGTMILGTAPSDERLAFGYLERAGVLVKTFAGDQNAPAQYEFDRAAFDAYLDTNQ